MKRQLSLYMTILLVGLVACSKAPTSGAGSDAAPVAKASEASGPRYLNFNLWNEPEYLDPGLMSGVYESHVGRALFEGLVGNDPQTAAPIPGAATHWDLSKDQRVYTFHIRQNAKWSDGSPLTAQDFAYAWERVLRPATGSKYAFALYYIKNAQVYNKGEIKDPKQLGIRVVNEKTIELTLAEPTPFFISFMAHSVFYPVPKAAIDAHGPKWTQPGKMISNGPFQIVRWTPYKEIVVEPNPHFHAADSVKLAGIRFLPIEDKETALKMYVAGDIDVNIELPEMKVPDLMKRPDYAGGVWNSSYFYRLNTRKPPLDDVRVRQALALSIDRDTLVNKYLQGIHKATTSFSPMGLGDYVPPKGFGYDSARAQSLMTAAGFPEGKGFPKIEILYNSSEHHKVVAQVIQQMWKKELGIDVSLRNEEWKSYLKSQQTGNYQVSRSGWIGDYGHAMTYMEMFLTASTINMTGWGNAEYDAAVANAMTATTPEKENAFMASAETILLREVPIVPLYTYVKHLMVKPYVKGFYPNIQDWHPFHNVSLDTEVASAK
jgi:oligopeptide transport system substrate-binding protein